MDKLNLPSFEYKLKKENEKIFIFDIIRKKFVVLFPEEWVRQHYIHYLINTLGYPKNLIRVESGLAYNQLSKRSDIVVYDRTGRLRVLVECKSPATAITHQVVFQVSTYNSTLQAEYVGVTNGLGNIYIQVDWDKRTSVQIQNLPAFDTI